MANIGPRCTIEVAERSIPEGGRNDCEIGRVGRRRIGCERVRRTGTGLASSIIQYIIIVC